MLKNVHLQNARINVRIRLASALESPQPKPPMHQAELATQFSVVSAPQPRRIQSCLALDSEYRYPSMLCATPRPVSWLALSNPIITLRWRFNKH